MMAQLAWNPLWPVTAVLVLAALCAGAAWWSWRGLAARFGARRARPILVVRSLLFLLLVIALLDPVLRRTVTQSGERQLLVLQDVSASMSVRDTGGETRAERARRLAARIRERAPSGVRVQVRTFETGLLAGDAAAAGTDKQAAEAAGTDVGATLIEAATRLETPDTAAVVLLTDGGDEPIQPVKLPVAPLIVLGMGSDGRSWRNVAVAQVEAPEVVEKDVAFTITADLAATGPSAFLDGLDHLGVSLLRRQEGGTWAPLDRRAVDLRRGRGRVTFSATCTEPGTTVYRVAAEPAPGELSTLDNRRTLRVEARRKLLDVLYFSRRLGADIKMLRQELGTDPGMTFTALYRSTGERYTVQAPPEGAVVVGEKELAKGFPTDLERLRRFDCLMLGSFPAHEWSADEMQAVLRFVEAGGGIILLGGDESFDGGGYAVSPLQPLLPWRCAGSASSLQRGVFPVSLPAAAEQHPAVAGLREVLVSGETNGAPAALTVASVNTPGDPLPGAEVLLEAVVAGRKVPLALEHRVGRGRILTVASNTTWLWARDAGAAAAFYRRFWRQAVRAACGQAEGGRVLQVTWNKTLFRPGERAVAAVRAPGAGDVKLRATVTGTEGSRPLTVGAGAEPAAWQVEWPVEARGVWTVQITAERGGETLEVYRKVLNVAPWPDEGSHLARQDAELERLAASGRGIYVREEDASAGALDAALAAYLRPALRVEARALVSDGPCFALMLVALVMTELALRRRLNLL